MASSLLILLDDIAAVLDDVALMSKVAAKKTAGVLGDDLALNAQQVSGVRTERELPVVWSVAKGSFINKLILVPLALLISVVAPWLINPLLVIGGLFLCFEGVEKVLHSLHHKKAQNSDEAKHEIEQIETDLESFEKAKIKGAVRTDFILSAEIVVISLGTVATAAFGTKVMVLSVIAIVMTVGVYGLVAMIVKIDVGTIAMFLVGGGIITHAVSSLHHLTEEAVNHAALIPTVGSIVGAITPTLINMVIGFVAGLLVVLVVHLVQKIRGQSTTA